MENNKKCSNCGTVNKFNSNFCQSCGVHLVESNGVNNEQNNINVNKNNNITVNNQTNNDSEGTKLGILSLILYFAGTTILSLILNLLPSNLRNIFSSLSGLSPLAGIVVMIIGRVKYPNNKFLKVVMWLIIGSIIFGLVAFVLFCIFCYVTCSNMDTRGCD